MHLKKTREEITKLSEETLQAVMRSFLTCVHLCTEEGGGHLKDIVHKKFNYIKKKLSTIVDCDVLKLVSVTFSKMLFLFIISSLFLPHSVLHLILSNFEKKMLTKSKRKSLLMMNLPPPPANVHKNLNFQI